MVEKRYVHGISDQDYFLFDLKENRFLDRTPLAEAKDGMAIYTLTGAADGNIYGSTYINQHIFRCDARSGKLTDLGKVVRIGGQVDSIHAGRDGKVYLGSYVLATLSIYDPAKPWNPGRDLPGNPRELGSRGAWTIPDPCHRPGPGRQHLRRLDPQLQLRPHGRAEPLESPLR